jgi:transcriptional regulator with XRE-family HTH domain
MRAVNYRKRPDVEERIGMSLERYVQKAGTLGLSQRDMAAELGVTQMTMTKWLREIGYEKVPTYRRQSKVA